MQEYQNIKTFLQKTKFQTGLKKALGLKKNQKYCAVDICY